MRLVGRARERVRAVAAAMLWVALSAAYIGFVYIVVVLGGEVVTSADGASTALTISAAAVVAVTFGPIRRRARRLANRLVLGGRATSLETLSQFSQGVAGAYGADEVLSGMAQVLVDGTGARRAEIWVVVGEHLRRSGVWPPAPDDTGEPVLRSATDWPDRSTGIDLGVPVRVEDDLLGVLALESRTGQAFSAAEESLVADLASHACLVLQNVRLSADLAARSEELAAQADALQDSRQRLVAARTAERRRVERNIHDGAQQHLVALLVRIGFMPGLVETDEDQAVAELAGMGPLCDEALATLADLAHGLHPRELTEGGLVAALTLRAERMPAEITTVVEDDGIGRYPSDIEAAAYFACLEALQNAVKYAQCSSVTVRLAVEDGGLTFTVTDDGIGFDTERVTLGAGMANMADRIEALNGSLTMTAALGSGATVRGTLPSGNAPPARPPTSLASPP